MINTTHITTRKDGRKQVTCYDTTHRPFPHRHTHECDYIDREREQNQREWERERNYMMTFKYSY